MKTLSQKQILALHSALIKEFGGSDGIRDQGLLESALAAPFQTFGGEPVYPSLQAKEAQLGFGLVCNHPFVDGNKRVSFAACDIFLRINGWRITAPSSELHCLMLHWVTLEPDKRFEEMEKSLRLLLVEI